MVTTTSDAECESCGLVTCWVRLDDVTASTAAVSHGKYLLHNL